MEMDEESEVRLTYSVTLSREERGRRKRGEKGEKVRALEASKKRRHGKTRFSGERRCFSISMMRKRNEGVLGWDYTGTN